MFYKIITYKYWRLSLPLENETVNPVETLVTNAIIITHPTMPVDIFAQEANDLIVIAKEDEAELTAVGLPAALIDNLGTACNTLRQKESDWVASFNSKHGAQQEWETLSPRGYAVFDDLLASARHGFRKNEDLTKRVRQIARGTGDADMLQSLGDLIALIELHPDLMQQINFDMAQLTEARTLCQSLISILSHSRAIYKDSVAKKNRDIAFTQCKILVDEIRDYGKYAFRNDSDRLEKYRSKYLHSKYLKYHKKSSEQTTEQPAKE